MTPLGSDPDAGVRQPLCRMATASKMMRRREHAKAISRTLAQPQCMRAQRIHSSSAAHVPTASARRALKRPCRAAVYVKVDQRPTNSSVPREELTCPCGDSGWILSSWRGATRCHLASFGPTHVRHTEALSADSPARILCERRWVAFVVTWTGAYRECRPAAQGSRVG